jgi:prepilin-type N-terminal cleavage/methylation domain-containing protein
MNGRPTDRDVKNPAAARAGGFTLIELLTVMGIIAVVFGMAVGSVARSGKAGALEGAMRVARSQLMRARMLATSEGALSRVSFRPRDEEARRPAAMIVEFTNAAGTWHFDDPPGIKALYGEHMSSTVIGGAFVLDGRLRGAIELTQASRVVSPSLDRAPTFNPARGFSLHMDVLPTGPGTVARFGQTAGSRSAFILRIEPEGAVSAEMDMIFDAESAASQKREKILKLKTPPAILELKRWVRIGLVYDGVVAEITVHGVSEAAVAESRDLEVPPESALVFGAGFGGLMDEAEYYTTGAAETIPFEAGVDVETKTPIVVRFDRDGRLNDKFHSGPVTVPFLLEDRRESTTVDLSGVVR